MNTFLEKVYARKYEDAFEYLKTHTDEFKSYDQYDNQQAYNQFVRDNYFDVIDFLLEEGLIETDVYEYNNFNRSIFESVLKNIPEDEGSMQYLKSFINKFDNINDEVAGKTLLSFALEEKLAPAIIQTLIEAGCDVSFKNNADSNLLIETVRLNMVPADKHLAYLKLFTDAGLDVNDTNVEKKNALHYAIESHKKDIIPFLLEHGAEANVQDWKGNTAFHLVLQNPDNDALLNTLIEHQSPDFEATNNDGEKPLAVFLRYMNGSERSLSTLEKLLEAGADLNQTSLWYNKEKSGWDWILTKKPEILEKAVSLTSFDVNEQDNNGNTLLHKVCAIDCNYSQETAKEIYSKVKFLLKQNADINITNNKDETAIMLASADNLKSKTVELLLKANH